MSIKQLLGRLIGARRAPRAPAVDTDTMSLRDWADLPAHHPARDSAPC